MKFMKSGRKCNFRLSITYCKTLIIFCILLSSSVQLQAQVETKSQKSDGGLMSVAHGLVEYSRKISKVWPGFWSNEQDFILMRPTSSVLLISRHRPPQEYVLLSKHDVPDGLLGKTYLRNEYLPGFGQNNYPLTYKVGVQTLFALEPRGSSMFGQIDFYLHESFHAYQNKWVSLPEDKFVAKFGQPLAEPEAASSIEFKNLGEIERRMLSGALEIKNRQKLLPQLRQYMAVRSQRLINYPQAKAVERRYERTEGTAEYVGRHSATIVTNSTYERLVQGLQDHLKKPLASFDEFPGKDAPLFRWRQYGTGAAICLILDRLRVKAWKKRVAEGARLDELLSEAIAFDPIRDAGLVKSALQTFSSN